MAGQCDNLSLRKAIIIKRISGTDTVLFIQKPRSFRARFLNFGSIFKILLTEKNVSTNT